MRVKKRRFKAEGYEHVYCRSANKAILFFDDIDRLAYYTAFSSRARKTGVVVLGLSIMFDHIHHLSAFATADGNAHQQELEAIRRISGWCGVDNVTYEALKMMYVSFSAGSSYGGGYSGGYGGGYSGGYGGGYYDQSGGSTYTPRSGPSLDDCYKILEVSPDATDEEVKKAYRVAAMKHHPDKVSHLGEDVRKKAEEKFAKVNEAYDKIKAARGMK